MTNYENVFDIDVVLREEFTDATFNSNDQEKQAELRAIEDEINVFFEPISKSLFDDDVDEDALIDGEVLTGEGVLEAASGETPVQNDASDNDTSSDAAGTDTNGTEPLLI